MPLMSAAPIRVHAHPPERRGRPVVLGSACCSTCCCCCCCCLHSLGGLIGATTVWSGTVQKALEARAVADPSARPPDYKERVARSVQSVSLLYWSTVALVTMAGSVAIAGFHFDLWYFLGAVILGLPLWQLLASLLVVAMMFGVTLEEPAAGWRALWQITVRSVLGATIGLLIMSVPVVLWMVIFG